MNPDTTVNLNHNSAKCIKTMTSWGYDTIYNICSGSHTQVPWGSIDYILNVGGVAFLILFCLVLLAIIAFIIYMIIDG